MSQNPVAQSFPPDDVRGADNAPAVVPYKKTKEDILPKDQPLQIQISPSVATLFPDSHAVARGLPRSLPPSSPIEPPLAPSAQLRPIGVHAILNHADRQAKRPLVDVHSSSSGRDAGDPRRTPLSPATSLYPTPSPMFHLSPTFSQPQPSKVMSLSPGVTPRRILTPVAPSARAGAMAGNLAPAAGKVSVAESPFVYEQLSALYHPIPASLLPLVESTRPAAPQPGHLPLPAVTAQPAPGYPSRRASASSTVNASSQASSPGSVYSTLSRLGRASPSLGSVGTQPRDQNSVNSSPRAIMEPLSQLAPLTGRKAASPPTKAPSSLIISDAAAEATTNAAPPGMIPCIIDLKSGSSSQAEKRKANSDASRRFRNRKKHEQEMEKKLAAQQAQIAKQMETIQNHVDEIRSLVAERDYYRSERDFYRDALRRYMPLAEPLPSRPPSPRRPRPPSDLLAASQVPDSGASRPRPEAGDTKNITATSSAPAARQSIRHAISSSAAAPSTPLFDPSRTSSSSGNVDRANDARAGTQRSVSAPVKAARDAPHANQQSSSANPS